MLLNFMALGWDGNRTLEENLVNILITVYIDYKYNKLKTFVFII